MESHFGQGIRFVSKEVTNSIEFKSKLQNL